MKSSGAISGFFLDLSQYLSAHVVAAEELLITGDMNFHLDLPDGPLAKKFLNSPNEQHVTGLTHVRGHTLDVVITRDNSNILQSVPRVDSQY